MEVIINGVLLIAGIFLGLFFYTFILLPIFYGLPRTIFYVLKGRLKLRAVFSYLVSPILWSGVVIATIFILEMFSLKVLELVTASGPFTIGQYVGIFFSITFSFTKANRGDLNKDFWDLQKKYLKHI